MASRCFDASEALEYVLCEGLEDVVMDSISPEESSDEEDNGETIDLNDDGDLEPVFRDSALHHLELVGLLSLYCTMTMTA